MYAMNRPNQAIQRAAGSSEREDLRIMKDEAAATRSLATAADLPLVRWFYTDVRSDVAQE